MLLQCPLDPLQLLGQAYHVGLSLQHPAIIAPLAGIVWPVADEPPQDKPASDAAAPKDDDDGFVAKLRKVLPDLLDEILGTEPEDKPEEKPKPSTLREKEDSVREQVARAVRELEEEARHQKEHEQLRQPVPPPQPEVKPWRHRFWGE